MNVKFWVIGMAMADSWGTFLSLEGMFKNKEGTKIKTQENKQNNKGSIEVQRKTDTFLACFLLLW